MGSDFELITDSNGSPGILFIDKGGKKVNVGSKLSDFIIQKKLGEGNFGSVYLVLSKITKKLYAMKEIKSNRYKTDQQRLEVEKEIKLLENLHHPHVITYFTSFRENDSIFIITEYINGGSLENLLKRNIELGKLIDEKTIWNFLIQSLSGLLYLHENKKIIHRDIKPDNLLLDRDGNIKISDFGVSAINSDNVEDLLKCHGTVRGPIQFMAPEVGLGLQYDFKSDIYMLGLTFFFMMSNTLPEKKIEFGPLIIPIKDKNAKIPDIYSDVLKNFIQTLLNSPDQRPSTKRAYSKAITIYSYKYLKITSICSVLQCFFSIKAFCNYFKGERVKTYIENSEVNDNRKYLITKTFKDAFINVNPSYFNYESAKNECLKFRIIFYANKERLISNSEIDPHDFIEALLNRLHAELNKPVIHKVNQNPGDFNIEDEENNNKNNQEVQIDETNEMSVISAAIKKFSEKFRSKISDLFYYIAKTIVDCPECQTLLKYDSSIHCMCGLYPERASIYLSKTDLNIYDLFKHYRKKRLFLDENINCPKCGKIQKNVNRTKIFYTSPINLILSISDQNENKYKLTIDEYINIGEFVQRTDVSNVNYHLIGAIFIEQNEQEGRKYVSITRKENNDGWFYFNGNSIQDCTFNDLINHKKLQILFYSSQ